MENEKNRLDGIADDSLYAAGIAPATIRYSYKIAERYFTGNSILEMGPAEGVMTELLVEAGKKLTLLEGAEVFCRQLKSRFPETEVVHSLFEDYQPDSRYDNIVLGHVLEHVDDPVAILSKAKDWLVRDTGRLFAAVPNARSLHRQAAVIMGLLSEEQQLNELDIHHGHRRVFNPESFRNAFLKAGMEIEVFGGYWMKPVSNAQIEASWSDDMLDAFMELGERYPDIAGEIYVVAKVSSDT